LDRGCVGVWLDTFSFQSRGFYEKLGYAVVGMIQDHPLGGARYFMQKRLVPPLGCTDAQRPI
ncbi:MAG: family acetyltransferase, partial [Alphaproteobacteria bacterium]|nr:family acetyltransferase [Alphaproteobacteria bacterium]